MTAEEAMLVANGLGESLETATMSAGALGTALLSVAGIAGIIAAIKWETGEEGQQHYLEASQEALGRIEQQRKGILESGNELTDQQKEQLELLEAQEAAWKSSGETAQKNLDRMSAKDSIEEVNKALIGYNKTFNDTTEMYEETSRIIPIDEFKTLQNTIAKSDDLTAKKSAVKDYVDSWSGFADTLKKAKDDGAELEDWQEEFVRDVDAAKGILKAYGDSAEEATSAAGSSFTNLSDRIDGATQSLQDFQNQMAGLTDYAAPAEQYQKTFDDLKKQYESETLDFFEAKAYLKLLVRPEDLQEFGGSVEDQVKGLIEGKLAPAVSKILGSTDILGAFNQQLLEISDGTGQVLGKDGSVVATIRQTSEGLESDVVSWEGLAEAMSFTDDELAAIAGKMQSTSLELTIMSADIDNLMSKITDRSIVSGSVATFDDLSLAIESIGTALETTDLDVIQEYLNTMQELGRIEFKDGTTDVTINANAEEVQTAIDTVKNNLANMEDTKTVTVETKEIGGQEAHNMWDSQPNGERKVNYVITRYVTEGGGVSGGSWSSGNNVHVVSGAASGWLPEYATGTDNSTDGLALVNDGSVVNGSQSELIVQDGNAFIANGGNTGLVNLKAGSTVYTAKETQDILKNAGLSEEDLYGGVPSFAHGIVSKTPQSSGGGYYAGGEDFTPQAVSEKKWLETLRRILGYGKEDIEAERKWAKEFADSNVKQLFDDWSGYLEHFYKMEVFTEEEYYKLLYNLSESYLKDREGLLEDYWRVQEKIYDYEKQDLTDIVELEEKLNELAKAKTQKVLVYKDGMFQYVQNTEAIAKAQRAVQGYANGTTNANGGMQLVGEHGAELRLLNQGDGIIPANLTRNLMRIGSMGIGAMGGYGDSYVLTIGTLKLEKVNDVDGLFNGLKNYAVQSAAMRK